VNHLWTISNLQRLDYSIRKKIIFYAPLTEHLDFYGIEPITYSWSGSVSAAYRGGSRTLTGPAPVFNFTGENSRGLYVKPSAPAFSLQFNAANNLNNANTLIWFEERVPKSTPTQTNPFDAGGNWTSSETHVSHICKANAVLANSEITAIQSALLDVAQAIPTPPEPPASNIGVFIEESPSGARNGTNKVFTLSQTPDLGSLEVFWAGLYLKRVPSAPDTLEFVASGSGNRTLTLGSAPESSHDLTAKYVTTP